MAEDAGTKAEESAGEVKLDYESAARDGGWKSKEELGEDFDPMKFVGAEEFVKRKPLFDTIKQQNKDLKKTIDAVVSFSQKNAELAAKRAVAELKAQKKEAISLGDVEKVEALDASIEQHKQVIAQKPPDIAPQVIEWTKQNDWFNKDAELQDFAVSWCQSFAKRHPDKSMEESLEATAKATKRAFPDSPYFKESRRQDPSPVETHKGEGGNSKTKKYTVDRLDDDQKRAYKQFMAKKVMSHDQYFQSLEEIGALS
jgi:cell fate (sporulation/competence/biofilm development) regulator YmcA (YheA/YmcA/DUF963 family)